MKQLTNSLQSGAIELLEVPCPSVAPNHLLIRTRASLISAGTEKMLVDFGRRNLLAKARGQPDQVRQVIERVRTDGLLATADSVRSKLDEPLTMGYANSGVVLEVGDGVEGFAVGDRVVSNGPHAEVVRVPKNLCARIPDGVSDSHAAFTVIGSIGLQGIRLAGPTLGECVVVTGLGLIGLLTVQFLRASGCRVLGIDFDAEKLRLARSFGAEVVNLGAGEDPLAGAEAFSRGRGVDAVLVTAATQSSEPLRQAARMCRKRGRIVLVGVTGLELSRADFYEKELSFQVSCSYGPGRYDPLYEAGGQDYPLGFVRWTQQRNFEAVLDMIERGALDLEPLISHRIPFEEAAKGYDVLVSDQPAVGILLDYPSDDVLASDTLRSQVVSLDTARPRVSPRGDVPVLGVVGAGNYASRVLIPALGRAGAILDTIANSGGVSGVHTGRKHGFRESTTDVGSVFRDPRLNAVVIATRHDTHGRFASEALRAGKHVFVEKPLVIRPEELEDVRAAYAERVASGAAPILMVGFNRRFAPHVVRMRALLRAAGRPAAFIMTVNAGIVPRDHWLQDPDVGGGRIIGEACHFIDLLRFLADAPVAEVTTAPPLHGPSGVVDDVASFSLAFVNGSIGTVHYLANGSRAFPKERLEVFCGGGILQLDNYRVLRGYGWPGFRVMRRLRQEKGNAACAAAFVEAIQRGSSAPIPLEELMEVSAVTLRIAEALRAR